VIAALLERASRRAAQADAVLKTDETTSLEFAAGELVSARTAQCQGLSLRVVAEGRAGFSGTVSDDLDDLLERALASAAAGDPTVLTLPPPAPLPAVLTHVPRAAAATVPELVAICHLVRDRMAGEQAELSISLERSIGSVRVANSRGVDASYDASLVSLAVRASRLRTGRRVMIEARLSGADLPALPDLEAVVGMLRQRLAWAERDTEIAPGRQRVLFLPAALPALLQPVEQGLAGKAALERSSLAGWRRGTRALSELLSLTDDPLASGRPGSRPVDDEGIPSRTTPLVKAGTIEGLIYDLETASRVGAAPTGHGRRSTFGKPQTACTNLVVEAGQTSWRDLLAAVGDGLVVERVRAAGPANVAGGMFAFPVTLGWRVVGGEVTGLLPEVTIAGNAHDLLNRIIAVGSDLFWVGSRAAPPVVVEGVSLF
jgi:PmbA protein